MRKQNGGMHAVNGVRNLDIDFVEGEYCPWSATKDDFVSWITPHHTAPLEGVFPRSSFPSSTKNLSLQCPCGSGSHSPNGVDTTCSHLKNELNFSAIEWLDPRGLPLACFERILKNALGDIRWKRIANVGVLIPRIPREDYPRLIAGTGSNSDIARDFSGRKPVWYPCLSNEASVLRDLGELINPIEVFPIVELPLDGLLKPDSELSAWSHLDLLEGMRVRTEKTIYLDPQRPELTYRTMANSFSSLQASGPTPKIPVVTPGGSIPTLLALAIAAVVNGSMIIPCDDPLLRIPVTKDDIWGFAIVRGKG